MERTYPGFPLCHSITGFPPTQEGRIRHTPLCTPSSSTFWLPSLPALLCLQQLQHQVHLRL